MTEERKELQGIGCHLYNGLMALPDDKRQQAALDVFEALCVFCEDAKVKIPSRDPKLRVTHAPESVYDFMQADNKKRLDLLLTSGRAAQLVIEMIDTMVRWCADKGIEFSKFDYDRLMYSRWSEKALVVMEGGADEKCNYEDRFTAGLKVKGEA